MLGGLPSIERSVFSFYWAQSKLFAEPAAPSRLSRLAARFSLRSGGEAF